MGVAETGVALMMVFLLASCSALNPSSGATVTGITDRNGAITLSGGTTTERVQAISGRVMNPAGADADTFGGKVFIVHNGDRQQVTPTTCYEEDCQPGEWEFTGDTVLTSGSNSIQTVVEDEDGNQVYSSSTFSVNADIPPRDITVTLTWDTDGNDVDLHVYDPQGNHAYYAALTGIPEGSLDLDDTDGFGPETFTMEQATAGTYTVKVRYYSTHGVTSNVPVTVRVSLNEGAPVEYTHTFTPGQANYDDATNDWTVTTFNMP